MKKRKAHQRGFEIFSCNVCPIGEIGTQVATILTVSPMFHSGLEPDTEGTCGPSLAQPVLPENSWELGAPHVPLGPWPHLPFLHPSPRQVLPPDVLPLQSQNGSHREPGTREPGTREGGGQLCWGQVGTWQRLPTSHQREHRTEARREATSQTGQ